MPGISKQIINQLHLLINFGEIQAIFLSNLNNIEEKCLFFIAKNNNIKIMYYDQGINTKEYFNRRLSFQKRVIEKFKFLNWFSPLDIDYKSMKNFSIDTYYSIGNRYPYKNIQKTVIVELQNSIYENIDIKSIFISRPLDGIINLKNEIKLLKYISNILPKNTFIKFHPRETDEKKVKILNETNFKYNLRSDSIPAELLIPRKKHFLVSGWFSTTLILAKNINSQVQIKSFVKYLPNSDYLISKHFPLNSVMNIEFVEPFQDFGI